MKKTLLALMGALSLASCEFVKETIDDRQYDPTDLEDVVEEKVSVWGYMKDNTFSYPQLFTSPQVDYYSEDGVIYTWAPEQERIIKGSWYVDKLDGYVTVCFEYPEDVFGDEADTGQEECIDADYLLYYSTGRVKGDPFDLQSERVPYVMEGDLELSFPELAVRANVPVGNLKELPLAE